MVMDRDWNARSTPWDLYNAKFKQIIYSILLFAWTAMMQSRISGLRAWVFPLKNDFGYNFSWKRIGLTRSTNIVLVSHVICLTVNSGNMTSDRVYLEGDRKYGEDLVTRWGENTLQRCYWGLFSSPLNFFSNQVCLTQIKMSNYATMAVACAQTKLNSG